MKTTVGQRRQPRSQRLISQGKRRCSVHERVVMSKRDRVPKRLGTGGALLSTIAGILFSLEHVNAGQVLTDSGKPANSPNKEPGIATQR